MRWADMDLLGHINNVVYVDYLQEARVDMMRAHRRDSERDDLAEGVVVVRHEVTYVAPLAFGYVPVQIECWVTQIRAASFTVAYEVFHESSDGDRTVYAKASTVLTPYVFAIESPRRITLDEREMLTGFLETTERPTRPAPVRRPPGVGTRYPVQVRFSDVDVYGHVNNVKYFEYLQEARISMMAEIWAGLEHHAMVVAQIDVDYRVPIVFRAEPYDAWSWTSRVGDRSATIESVICDGETVLARARVVIVFFDPDTERSTTPPEAYLESLRTLLPE